MEGEAVANGPIKIKGAERNEQEERQSWPVYLSVSRRRAVIDISQSPDLHKNGVNTRVLALAPPNAGTKARRTRTRPACVMPDGARGRLYLPGFISSRLLAKRKRAPRVKQPPDSALRVSAALSQRGKPVRS